MSERSLWRHHFEFPASTLHRPASLAKTVSPDRHSLHLQREAEGRRYVEFEFASKAPNYIRHALASVTVANGKPMPFISISCRAHTNMQM